MTDSKQTYGSIDSVNLTSKKKNPKHGYRMILITIVVLLVAIGGVIVSQQKNLQKVLKDTTEPTVTDSKPATTGTAVEPIEVATSTIQDRDVAWLEVVSTSSGTFSVGETKKLYINGTSGNRDVTAYDFLLVYDPTMLEIQTVTSALPDYEIFKFDRGDHMTITGIKDFKKREPVMFTGSNILEIVVKAKRQGSTVFSLQPDIGQEKTQIVDAEVKVIEPQIGSIQLTIQ